MKGRIRAAVWLYRWTQGSSIIGIVFSALSFAGIFAILFGASSLIVTLPVVLLLFFGLGTALDRIAKFWSAQSLVGTVRNPFLVNRMYQKELIVLKVATLTELHALRYILVALPTSPHEPKFLAQREELVARIDESISRIGIAVAEKKWTVEPGEDTYEDSG